MIEPLRFRHVVFDGSRPYLVGVLNVTPDSFSDGGRHSSTEAALARAAELEREGADWIDVGGESTRPRSEPVPAAEELRRVIPVITALAQRTQLPISVDTYKAEVADAALLAGAEVVNDISGGRLDPDILRVAARRDAAMVLGHLRGEPRTMQESIDFQDVYVEVAEELAERVLWAHEAGVRRIVVDPGLGFGKGAPENLELIRRAGALSRSVGKPVMIGASRKSFVGEWSGVTAAADRVIGSVVAALFAVRAGAQFVRVHDVAATRQALAVGAVFGQAEEEA